MARHLLAVRLGAVASGKAATLYAGGSFPKAPATFLAAGIDRSEYFDSASFCAMERLPALCDVCRSRASLSGSSPTRPAAS